MSKIDDFAFRGESQDVIDFKDAVRDLLNFGKYQAQVVSSVPNWTGRAGEHVWYVDGTDGRLYLAAVDNKVAWTQVLTFTAITG